MSEVLFEEISPNGNVQAILESDGAVCFFYLYGAPETELGIRSVWVRNLVPAPTSLDRESMLEGNPPLNPVQYCRHPEGLPVPQKDRLGVVWLPEGNGAALLEGDEVVAVIPPWSGTGGFNGYARDCIGEGPLAWELSPDNALLPRIDAANSYWQSWNDDGLWPSIQGELVGRIETKLGRHSNYYAIDGGNWPPKAILRIPLRRGTALVTVGVCVRPQPNVEMYTDDPAPLKRIELGAVLPPGWTDEAIKRFAGYLSAQSNLPWTHYTWLGPGHTIPCDSWVNDAYAFALLTSVHAAAPSPDLGMQFGDPVHVLWFNPISESERASLVEGGAAAPADWLPEGRWEEA